LQTRSVESKREGMRSFTGALSLVVLSMAGLGGAGCASSAARVKPTMQAVPETSAIVVGKFGALSSIRRAGLFYELQALNVQTSKKWNFPLSADDADGSAVPFFLELPPGLYLLTKWMYMSDSRREYRGENAGVLFDLAPGQVTCIGAIYMGTRERVRGPLVGTTQFRGGAVLRDECAALGAQLKAKAPLLPAPVTRLARGATQQRAQN
jgi:hypothetical protein